MIGEGELSTLGQLSNHGTLVGYAKQKLLVADLLKRHPEIHDIEVERPVVIAGPTCDGADILYEHAGYTLPLELRIGDKVRLLSTGAYTTTYASVGFNGFTPLKDYYV